MGTALPSPNEEFAGTTFDTITGPVRFGKQNNVKTVPGVAQIQNGMSQLVWPPQIATSKFQPKTGWN